MWIIGNGRNSCTSTYLSTYIKSQFYISWIQVVLIHWGSVPGTPMDTEICKYSNPWICATLTLQTWSGLSFNWIQRGFRSPQGSTQPPVASAGIRMPILGKTTTTPINSAFWRKLEATFFCLKWVFLGLQVTRPICGPQKTLWKWLGHSSSQVWKVQVSPSPAGLEPAHHKPTCRTKCPSPN